MITDTEGPIHLNSSVCIFINQSPKHTLMKTHSKLIRIPLLLNITLHVTY